MSEHQVRDTGDDHWMTGWPRWICSCGATGAARRIPRVCPDDPDRVLKERVYHGEWKEPEDP